MADFYIGLSGLAAAQRAFDIIGNNIANASTEGYHKQRLELSPAFSLQPGTSNFIGGVNIEDVSRMIDTMLEQELLRQKSTLAAVSQDTSMLGTIEAAFGEFATENGGLSAAIDTFFNSLQNLSIHPEGNVWQNQVVSDAQAMAEQFKTLGLFLNTLQDRIKLEAQRHAETINSLVDQIAYLNGQIERIDLIGSDTNSMRDQRDQYVTQLAELIDIQPVSGKNGVIDINSAGIPLVSGAFASQIETGFDQNGRLGISVKGADNYTTAINGGALGSLLAFHNETAAGYLDDLNALANAIIQEINSCHVMGIGTAGSFTNFTGWPLSTDNLSEISGISDGTVYIRLTNNLTGEITKHAVAIDADGSLSDVATTISAINGLTASVNSSNEFSIMADANYSFDFMPAVLLESSAVDFDDAAAPTVNAEGIYTGHENDTLQFLVKGDGSVGNGTLQLEVRTGNGTGNLIKTLNIGSGYAAGDLLDIGNGLKISLSTGNLAQTDGDEFYIDTFADTDTSGFLSAVGINTFFSGSSAMNMAISSDVLENPLRIAASIGPEGSDNANITKMAALKNKAVGNLQSLTFGEFYRKLVAGIGQELSIKQMQQDNSEALMLNLKNRQSEISGVDINQEAAQLIVFEQMFTAMAKFIATINDSLSSLMEVV